MGLFEDILKSRGLSGQKLEDFLHPNYDKLHDPMKLPDMKKAVNRIVGAHKNQENITIYGDYDIDGLTATALLGDALKSFGFKNVKTFIPNRFVEGYGLTIDAMESIAKGGSSLVITVDCGSLSHEPISRAKELGMDVIVTDHHTVGATLPRAVAVINPKRSDHDYPFVDLSGVGVAFKLAQALQQKLDGLDKGQEKWLLDLVALGTVCDVVTLLDENRTLVYYGLKVLAKTRREGLLALSRVCDIDMNQVTTRDLGFSLGPRLNASGRLETAQYSLELLTTKDHENADRLAKLLDEMNKERRREQDIILEEASEMAAKDISNVLVLSSPNWNHGIVGIVAATILEKYKKPTFILQELGETSKGSARSYGDFSAVEAINHASEHIIKGGGHKLAAGVTLDTSKITDFRKKVNEFYIQLSLENQETYLLPESDATARSIDEISEQLVNSTQQLEPFGNGNLEPVIKIKARHLNTKLMGNNLQHVKITVGDATGNIDLIRFSAPEEFKFLTDEALELWIQPSVNEWNNQKSVEGKLLHFKIIDS